MTWWLWIVVLIMAAWLGGLICADVMMRRGQSSFFRESIPERPPILLTQPKANHQQQRIEALECKIARLEHIADLADKLVKNAWTDEYTFNPDTYTVFGDDVAQLSAALLVLEFEEATSVEDSRGH